MTSLYCCHLTWCYSAAAADGAVVDLDDFDGVVAAGVADGHDGLADKTLD